ncbi:1,6-anhydro-N-acetylmuramyl-L-alanine amidase AmpD [Candidatus Foliamicus sp.]
MNPETGLMRGARQSLCRHRDQRPPQCEARLIVLHAISLPPGQFGGTAIEDLFHGRLDSAAHAYFRTLAGRRLSAHFLVRRDGELVQFVSILERAWHAGESAFRGQSNCNDYSVGLELEGDEATPFTDRQYNRVCAAIIALRDGLASLRNAPVVGHSDIAPGRKWDPGPTFDWARLALGLARAAERHK